MAHAFDTLGYAGRHAGSGFGHARGNHQAL